MPSFSVADENGSKRIHSLQSVHKFNEVPIRMLGAEERLFWSLQARELMSYRECKSVPCHDYSFEGLQFGFRFSANAFRPSRAFSPDCRGSLNRSIVN
jgi:hypothetical protein